MAFVDVPDGRLEAHRRERARAADAEHDLLLEARGAVAAVEAVRDGAVALAVLSTVGIEQEEASRGRSAPATPSPRTLAPGKASSTRQLAAVRASPASIGRSSKSESW